MRRKRDIDRLARQAAAEGYEQLVVLGAGLDTLAFRLHQERLYQRILSADHAATLAVIRSAMHSFGPPAGSAARDSTVDGSDAGGVELLALDFAHDDVGATLAGSRTFDSRRATLVVIEGVLMYLSESNVGRLLGSLSALPTPTLRLVASSMIAEPGQPVGFRGQSRLVGGWLSRRNEPMLWASTRSALMEMLAKFGWTDGRIIDLAEIDPVGGAIASGLPSEQLAVVERHRPS